ncbi:MAG TPA: hypothetical protein VIK64_10045 [Anaerolineales bacterium]
MAVRLFDWRDLPALFKYRDQGLFLDKALVLTRGTMLVPGAALLSYFAPATGIFTYLYSNDGNPEPPLIGQVMHSSGSSFARLTFLAPKGALVAGGLSKLLEHMIVQVGERGGMHLLAEVDEQAPVFEAFRQNSFAIYARQRIWKLSGDPAGEAKQTPWRGSSDRDLIPIRSLYNNLVPGLVQQVEQPPTNPANGLVYQEGEDLLAYVEVRYGARGIWVQPFVHPEAKDIADRLVDLFKYFPNRRSRPIFICIRSYQSWLETPVENLGAEASPLQSLMVKHLAITRKVAQSIALRNLETGHPEATAPYVRSESKK